MTNEEFWVEQRLTFSDRLMFYSWVAPMVCFFGMLLTIVVNDYTQTEAVYPWLTGFIVGFFGMVVCRFIYGAKVRRLMDEWDEAQRIKR